MVLKRGTKALAGCNQSLVNQSLGCITFRAQNLEEFSALCKSLPPTHSKTIQIFHSTLSFLLVMNVRDCRLKVQISCRNGQCRSQGHGQGVPGQQVMMEERRGLFI